MIGLEMLGCALAMAGSARVLTSLTRGEGLFRAWLVFMLALALALLAMMAAMLDASVPVVAGLRIASNTLWAATAVGFATNLGRAELGAPMRGAWAKLTLALAIGSVLVLAVYLWLDVGADDPLAWRLRRLVGLLADLVVVNACAQVVRQVWPMRAGKIARPYVFFILAALTFVARELLALLGAPVPLDAAFGAAAWAAVMAAPWSQARLTRSLLL